MQVLLRASGCRCGSQFPYLAKYNISTASGVNPYPYPSNLNPTPHQIFHLPPSASQKEVKARYYELVRIYHPDSPVARAYPPEVSEAQFHAISVSYDILRGRRAALDPDSSHATSHARVDLHALWRMKQHHHQDPMGPIDDRWKDGIILGSLIVALGAFVYQIAASRQRAVSEVLQTSKRPGTEGAGLRRASQQRHDVELLTASDSGSPTNPPSSLR
ncbi:hypothetical protein BJV78DRAFT_1169288 [Lactifluus subvellereus]|nr:hypothetical protein BJV78DRAFT_1169288 [Lactifluus subvellereus]